MSGHPTAQIEEEAGGRDGLAGPRRWGALALSIAAFGGVTLFTILIAKPRMFTGFAGYDDEGYMLVALQAFVRDGNLYDAVFSQYGPFYFETWGAVLTLLGVDVTHDVGRVITLVVWVASSLVVGVATARIAGSVVLGLGTQMATFYAIGTLTGEPMHPGGLICLLLAALIAVATLVRQAYSPGPLAALGAISAALLLVKVNVGVFAIAAALLVASSCYPALSRRFIRLAIEGLVVALPVVLLSAKFGEAWAREYAWQVAIASLALVIALRAHRGEQRPNRELLWFAGGATALAAGSCLVAIGLGTSLAGLVDGMVRQPLRQADAFTIPLALDRSFWLPSVLGLAGAALYAAFAARMAEKQWAQAIVAALSLAAGVALVLAGIGRTLDFDLSMVLGFRFEFLAFAWIAVIPSPLSSYGNVSLAQLLLPAVAVLQALHAYPVAGSQIAWSTFLLIPVGAICIANALRGFAHLRVAVPLRLSGGVALAAAGVAFSLFLVDVTLRTPLTEARAIYRASEPLDLPGAEEVRVGSPEADVYRSVTAEIRENCDSLLMLPGMNSFYLWSELPPVTGHNATAWPTLFDERRQRSVVEAARHADGLCVLRHNVLVAAWSGTEPPDGPLVRYLSDDLVPIASVGDYELFRRESKGGS